MCVCLCVCVRVRARVEVGNASIVLVVETLRIIALAKSTFRLSNTNRFSFVTTLSLGGILWRVRPGVPLCAVPPVRGLTCTETQGQVHETDTERERSSVWTVSICLIMGDTSTSAGFYENGDELSCSYEVGNLFDRLDMCRLSSRS